MIGASLAGALVARRLNVPLGALMGAIAGTVLVQNLGLTSLGPAPPVVRHVLYSAVGLMVGLRVTRSSLRRLREAAIPAAVVPTVMILSGILLGLLYATLTPEDSELRLDLQTAVLSITPGGFQEMAIAAQDMDAVLPVVLTTHMIRILTVLYTYPAIVQAIARRTGSSRVENPHATRESGPENEAPLSGRKKATQWLAILGATTAGGAFGAWSGVPAGTVVFAMLGAAAAKTAIGADSAALPRLGRLAIQVSLGTVLGLQVSLGPLARAGALVVPLAISLVLLIAISVATGLLIWRVTRTDPATALWMTAPGGLMEISVMAEAMKVDVLPVLAVHTARVALIIAVQPSLVLALSGLQ